MHYKQRRQIKPHPVGTTWILLKETLALNPGLESYLYDTFTNASLARLQTFTLNSSREEHAL